jgi:three-Cys-motif partner protein
MAYKDLHNKPFDSGTIAKLDIFEDYAQAWIPTFVMQSVPEIHIFDFFSGPGYDTIQVEGSPIRLLQKINEQLGNILVKKTKIVLHFNEYEPNKKNQTKFESLKLNCTKFIEQNPKFKYFLTVNYYNEDAEVLFFKLLPIINKYPSLVYLDQNGVKFISKEYMDELDKVHTTDFLYFVSSSYFKRLGSTQAFKKFLDFDKTELEKEQYRNIHRKVINKIKSNLHPCSKLKLFPFSLRKGPNIYGIVFGTKNYAAVDKFLSISWKRNCLNGEADFDIDEDNFKDQLDLFEGKKMTKIQKFQSDLEKSVLDGKINSNRDALLFSYNFGHIPQHAVTVIKSLKSRGVLIYEGKTPAINYNNVFRHHKIIMYKLKFN